MIPPQHAKADLHCHSTASEAARLGIQRSLGLPECATPPEEVYELAKSRGMDFVTITDHDSIAGCLEISHEPDVFISEELTAWFRGEEQAVHVLCYGITGDDHEFLQAHARDLETCAAYLREREITCALAHPFFAPAAPLTATHRRRLARLFPIWEVRNGSRARELNTPAAVYIETHGGIGVGGSDDHAGVDIGRTWTQTPAAATPEAFLALIRNGQATAHGEQGSAAKWAHSALALATRALLREDDLEHAGGPVSPLAALEVAERIVADGAARGGSPTASLGPREATGLLRAWLASVDLPAEPRALLELMKSEHFSHAGLCRRAKRIHERELQAAVARAGEAAVNGEAYEQAAIELFEAVIPAIPYVPATTILEREKAKLATRDGDPRRVALVVDAIGSMHGVAHTVERIREHGVPGYDIEVIGTDPRVDRRLPAAAEVEIPFYAGMRIGVPSLPELAATLGEGHYDLIHLASPGPAGAGAALIGRIGATPLIGSYHTELGAYAGLRSRDATLEAGMRVALSLLYRQCELVLSPSPATDESIVALGVDRDRIGRWIRGVDQELYRPDRGDRSAYPGDVRVLYAGRLAREKGIDLLAESFLQARARDPRLHLLVAGGGPDEVELRKRLGDAATFLGWLDREQLADAYSSADIFLFCSQTDTYGQVIAEAQASGLPVVAVAAGGPEALVRDRQTGWLCRPDPGEIAAAVAQLAASPFLRERLARGGLEAVRGRTWEAAFGQLAAGYDRALGRGQRAGGPAHTDPVAPAPVVRAA